MTRPSIELHIEELVLEGFAPSERYSVADAVERELTHLLAAGGVAHTLAAGESRASVDAGTARLAPGGGGRAAGSEIARAIYGGLNR